MFCSLLLLVVDEDKETRGDNLFIFLPTEEQYLFSFILGLIFGEVT